MRIAWAGWALILGGPFAWTAEPPFEQHSRVNERVETGSESAAQVLEVPQQLSVQQAEELLIKNNLAVIAARYGIDAARAQRIVAAYHPNPSVLVAGQQFDLDFPQRSLVTNSPSAANRTYTLEFDLPIETGGKRRKRISSAQSQIDAAEAQVLDSIRQQLFLMKTAYFSAVLARENARVATEVLESVDATEKLIQRQVAAGNTAETQLITLQANRIQFEQALVSAQLSYEQSIRDLLNFMGATPADIMAAPAIPDAAPRALSSISLADDLSVPPVLPAIEELRARTDQRPDVIAAQRNLEFAERSFDVARAGRSPDITVGTQFARVGNDNTGGMSFVVPLPLFNHKEGEIAQAEAQINTARTQLKQLKLQALTDVDKAWRAYELNSQVTKLYDDSAVSKARQSLEIAEKAFGRGGASMLDVLDARRTYRQTLVARDQARFNLRQSVLQLEFATGASVK